MCGARSDKTPVYARRPWKAVASVIVAWSFLFNCIGINNGWAADRAIVSTSPGAVSDVGGLPVMKELNPATFTLPKELGRINSSWTPEGYIASNARNGAMPVVIHIQDAHCNYEAQKKIAGIIEYLNKEYGLNTLNMEGASKGFDLSVFTDIQDRQVRQKVADKFVREGLMNGAEYFAVNNPEKADLWGIEDTDLYLKNLKVYRDSLNYKDEADGHLKNLSQALSLLKTKIYSKELLEFDMKYSQYKADNIDFKEYLGYLAGKAKTSGVDVASLPNIFLLYQVLSEESEIDFKKANAERDELIDRLHKRLSINALQELVLRTVEFSANKTAQKDFYYYIVEKAKGARVDVDDLKELGKYISYIETYDRIDKTGTMAELNALEEKVRERLFATDEERRISVLSKDLALLKNIFNITITKDDYEYYRSKEDDFNVSNFISFMNRVAPLHGVSVSFDNGLSDLDRYRAEISEFYKYSFARDDAFLRNMKMKRGTILVTGGFHTENLCSLFKKNNIAYISIMPEFRNVSGYKSPYFNVLAGGPDDTDRAITAVLGSFMLATPSILNALSDLANGSQAHLKIQIRVALAGVQIENKAGVLVYDGNGAFKGALVITGAGVSAQASLPENIDNYAELRLAAAESAPYAQAIESVSGKPAAASVDIKASLESTALPKDFEILMNTGREDIVNTLVAQADLAGNKLLEFTRKGDAIYNETQKLPNGNIFNNSHMNIFGNRQFGFFAVGFVAKGDLADKLAAQYTPDRYPDGIPYSDYPGLYEQGALKFYGILDGNLQPMSSQLAAGVGLNLVELNKDQFEHVVEALNLYKAALAQNAAPAPEAIGVNIYRAGTQAASAVTGAQYIAPEAAPSPAFVDSLASKPELMPPEPAPDVGKLPIASETLADVAKEFGGIPVPHSVVEEWDKAGQADRDNIVANFREIAKTYKEALALLEDMLQPSKQRTICLPATQMFCPLEYNEDGSRSEEEMQKVRKAIKDMLSRRGINNVDLQFHNNTPKGIKEMLSKVDSKTDNTIVFLGEDAIEQMRGDKTMETLLKEKATFTPLATPANENAYMSIGGHVALGLGILDIVDLYKPGATDVGDGSKMLDRIKFIIDAITRGETNMKAFSKPDELYKAIVEGKFIIKLPPIRKININETVTAHIAMELAVARAL